ncbi:MAG: hypothetical protein EOM62_15180, partial [Bacteroidia bacterium]|nr:hypothetical protein [Bacteroidia bacterium]
MEEAHYPQSAWFDPDDSPAKFILVGDKTQNLMPSVTAPIFSPAPGTYAQAQTIQLSCSTAGATIKYTTDGSNPSPSNGAVYNGPFVLNSSTTIKAMAYRNGYNDSPIRTGSYTINQSFQVGGIGPSG